MESERVKLRDRFAIPETHGVVVLSMKEGECFSIGDTVIQVKTTHRNRAKLVIIARKDSKISRRAVVET